MKSKIILLLIICPVLFFAFCFHNIVFMHSKALFEKQAYSRAVVGFRYLSILKPDVTEYRYYFVKTLAQLPPTYENQILMYKYSSSDVDDSAKFEAAQKVNEWKKSIIDKIGKNYIEQAPMNSKILRWNKSSFPLGVYVDYNSMTNLPDYYKSSVNSALNQWEKSIDFVSFVNSTKKNGAKILISFTQMPNDICSGNACKFVTAFTEPKIYGNTLKQMVITVYDRDPHGQYFSNKELYNSLLHEIGHALGIMGHSYSTEDLMYQQTQNNSSVWSKFRSEFQYINGRDVNTIKLLYMLAPDITDTPEQELSGLIYPPIIFGSPEDMNQRKLREAQIYVKKSPNLSGGYVDMANAYIELKEYNKAINALNSASERAKSDIDNFYIYYAYALAYLNLEKYDMALKYAELSRSIKKHEQIDELISVIKMRGSK